MGVHFTKLIASQTTPSTLSTLDGDCLQIILRYARYQIFLLMHCGNIYFTSRVLRCASDVAFPSFRTFDTENAKRFLYLNKLEVCGRFCTLERHSPQNDAVRVVLQAHSNLEVLKINAYSIFSVVLEFRHMTRLRELDISHCRFAGTPLELPGSLEVLQMRGCGTADSHYGFPILEKPGFGHLSNLRRLGLDLCNLSGMPTLPPSLIHLDLSSNRLGEVPWPLDFSHLLCLQHLNLSHNRLIRLPKDLPCSLTKLEVNGNRLDRAELRLAHLVLLKELDAIGCHIDLDLCSLPPQLCATRYGTFVT
jgi:hypothetical protein